MLSLVHLEQQFWKGGLGKIEVSKTLPQSPRGQNIFITLCTCAALSHFGHVWLFAPLCTHLPMGFTRQEYWSELPCLHPGDLPDLGMDSVSLTSPALQASSLPPVLHRKSFHHYMKTSDFFTLILSWVYSGVFQRLHDTWCHSFEINEICTSISCVLKLFQS